MYDLLFCMTINIFKKLQIDNIVIIEKKIRLYSDSNCVIFFSELVFLSIEVFFQCGYIRIDLRRFIV